MRVLDHGYVELIDMMGQDNTPANAARVSYGKDDKRDWDKDAKLTKYLADHNHTSPFEMVELMWKVKAPIFVARQWLRHRTANVNEFSMRYADPATIGENEEIEFYTPEIWREQGRGQTSIDGDGETSWEINRDYPYYIGDAINYYYELIGKGVARELARIVLPTCVYTEFIWKNDLHNTLHFLKLRTAEDAQWEIRQYAKAMVKQLQGALPELMAEVWEDA